MTRSCRGPGNRLRRRRVRPRAAPPIEEQRSQGNGADEEGHHKAENWHQTQSLKDQHAKQHVGELHPATVRSDTQPVEYRAADDVTDDEIREGIRLLAENEGIFAETAGGVTTAVAKKLIASGKIPANDSAVLCITGNGLKTLDAVVGHVGKTREIKPSLREFEAMLASEEKVSA